MQAGRLDRQVTIERRTTVADPLGGAVVTWVPFATLIWANIRNITGAEAIRNGVQVGTTKSSVRIRYREDIDQTCRLLYRGQVYAIEQVLPDEQGRESVDLVCSTGANDG